MYILIQSYTAVIIVFKKKQQKKNFPFSESLSHN